MNISEFQSLNISKSYSLLEVDEDYLSVLLKVRRSRVSTPRIRKDPTRLLPDAQ